MKRPEIRKIHPVPSQSVSQDTHYRISAFATSQRALLAHSLVSYRVVALNWRTKHSQTARNESTTHQKYQILRKKNYSSFFQITTAATHCRILTDSYRRASRALITCQITARRRIKMLLFSLSTTRRHRRGIGSPANAAWSAPTGEEAVRRAPRWVMGSSSIWLSVT